MADKMHFEVMIHASPEKVYKRVIDDATYREWTEPFSPGSYYEGSWQKNEKILFLGPDKEGKMHGMVSRIEENIPNEYISIEHLGLVKDGQEITSGEGVDTWKGAHENYTLERENGDTRFKVDLDTNGEMEEFFRDTWPKALDKLKEVCER
jgi:uncharacterized protein YndB with AHSA1/START domain